MGSSGKRGKLRTVGCPSFVPFRYFNAFSKQPFRRYYTQPTPSGKPFPHFLHNFLLHPPNPAHFLSNPAAHGGGR
jgi:hypothetical protein